MLLAFILGAFQIVAVLEAASKDVIANCREQSRKQSEKIVHID